MKTWSPVSLGLLAILAATNTASAQLQQPEQFYTNGEKMVRQPADDAGSQSRLLRIPRTAEYPRLRTSSWDAIYTTPGLQGRIRARVDFNGNEGTYAPQNGQGVGRLTNVEYQSRGQQG